MGWRREIYERKVDLPQRESPRRRMETVGGGAMGRVRLLMDSISSFRWVKFAKTVRVSVIRWALIPVRR